MGTGNPSDQLVQNFSIGEAQLREQIAGEILDYADANHPKHKSSILCQRCDITAAYRNAAKIARGEE